MNEQTAATVEKLTQTLLLTSRGQKARDSHFVDEALSLGMEGWKQLGVNCLQRARFTVGSPDAECEAGFALRREFLAYTAEVVDGLQGCLPKEKAPVLAMFGSLARRWAEGDIRDSDHKPVGVSFGDRAEIRRKIKEPQSCLFSLVLSPFCVASSALDAMEMLPADTETLNFAAYERGQIAALTNRHAEGVEILTRSAANCEKRGDVISAAVCKLQAAFVGAEGRISPDADEKLLAAWVANAPVLGEAASTSSVAKHWLAVNFLQGHAKRLEQNLGNRDEINQLKVDVVGYLAPRPGLSL